MKLYEIKYASWRNDIIVDEFDVEEKPKTLVGARRRFIKENLNKVINNYGYEIITLDKNKINDCKVAVLESVISNETVIMNRAKENIKKAQKLKERLPF